MASRRSFPVVASALVLVAVGACGTEVNLGRTGGCPAGEARCDLDCVSLDDSAAHCGACGLACPSGRCSGGVCEDCAPPFTACPGGCVDMAIDSANCGGCGVACPPGLGCLGGSCSCGGLVCDGACIDPTSDPQHCGACFLPCLGPNQFCVGGSCVSRCPDGLTACGDLCVDILYDSSHCGGCFAPCPPGSYCDLATCVPECAFNEAYCEGQCIDVEVNHENCGGCGIPCAPEQICADFYCQCPGAVCGVCDVVELGSVTQTVTGSTVGQSDDASGSCTMMMQGADAGYSFTPAATGVYAFDTSGSSFDTALYVLDAAGCFELACDALGSASHLAVPLYAGQSVLVVIDGDGAEQGDYVLDLQLATDCPASDLGSTVPQTVNGSTASGTTYLEGSCAFTTSPEATYRFSAPADGMYTFDTQGSSFDTVLYLLDDGCGSFELGCNDDAMGFSSSLTVALFAGQQVVVVVDGYGSGAYVLNVQ